MKGNRFDGGLNRRVIVVIALVDLLSGVLLFGFLPDGLFCRGFYVSGLVGR